jgi:hypothetical protein
VASEHRDAAAPTPVRACVGDTNVTPELVREVAESSFAFRATITQVHAKTLPDDVDPANLVVARVDAIGFAGSDITELRDTWGSTLTIDLKTADLPVGATAYFFTRLEAYNGGQLEVAEVGRVPARPDLGAEVSRIRKLLDGNPLYAALATSESTIAGRVTAIRPSGERCGSEHCPGWQIATIEVTATPCGTASPTIEVAFAGSDDVAWIGAPKLHVGQEGVFLLHRLAGTPALAVTRAIEVQSTTELATIEALLASPPRS